MKNSGKDEFERCDQVFTLSEEFKGKLSEAVRGLTQSCRQNLGTEHLDSITIPSKESVIEILAILEDILYPGYFGEQELSESTLEYYIGTKVHKIFDRLSYQISRVLIHQCPDKKKLCTKCIDEAQHISFEFLLGLSSLRKILASDVRAAYDGDPAAKSFQEIVFSYPGLKAITIYRIANMLFNMNVPLIPRIMTEYAHSLTGIDIHPGAGIGRRFFIDHGTGVVIGETTVIGENVRIYQGVTLGALSFPTDEHGNIMRGKKRHPTIENDVTIYAGATILGGDTVIGKGSTIGGNVWITTSVKPYTKVIISNPEHLVINIPNAEKKKK